MDPFSSYSARSCTRDKKGRGWVVSSWWQSTRKFLVSVCADCWSPQLPVQGKESPVAGERSRHGLHLTGVLSIMSCGHTGRISTLQMLQPVSPENSAHWVMYWVLQHAKKTLVNPAFPRGSQEKNLSPMSLSFRVASRLQQNHIVLSIATGDKYKEG